MTLNEKGENNYEHTLSLYEKHKNQLLNACSDKKCSCDKCKHNHFIIQLIVNRLYYSSLQIIYSYIARTPDEHKGQDWKQVLSNKPYSASPKRHRTILGAITGLKTAREDLDYKLNYKVDTEIEDYIKEVEKIKKNITIYGVPKC